MNNALSHRGPDDAGIFTDKRACLGHRRLSIIDLSAAGHQPMFSTDGNLVVVFNGEIYNYRSVKAEIKDYHFKTNSDTEVLIAAWEKWGVACLDKLNGMFAFAIHNREKSETYVVRDRMGIKPLYYSALHNALIFSSELRALLSSELVEKKLDPHSMEEFLRYQTVFAPGSIIRDVKMLLPGHFIHVHSGNVKVVQWWKPEIGSVDHSLKYEEACNKVMQLFSESVERRMISDVPFGAFLSGGIDSTAVAGMMSRISSRKISTFNISFDETEFSESVYARKAAKKFDTDHHEIVLKPEHFLSKVPDALSAMDHPSGDGPNTYVVSEATKSAGITMALSGLGGDELFCGYDIFKRAYALEQRQWLNNIPKGLRSAGGKLLKSVRPGVGAAKIADILSLGKINFSTYYPKSREVLNDEIIRKLLVRKSDWKFPAESSVYGLQGCIASEFVLSRISLAEISTYMQNTLLRDADQMSMAHALEVRVPFLDYHLVEFVLGLPDSFKYPSTPKKLFVDAMGDLLPGEIVNRPKMGFTFPWKEWMRNELNEFCAANLAVLSCCDYFNSEEINHLHKRFINGDPLVTWSRIWHLVVLGYWIQKNGIETC